MMVEASSFVKCHFDHASVVTEKCRLNSISVLALPQLYVQFLL